MVSERLGIERRKGVWCRCDAAEALIALGDHERARRLLEDAAALVPLGVDALRTDFLSGHLMIRLGDFAAASEDLERARTNGAHLLDDQLVGPLFQGVVEVLTWRGEHAAARQAALAAADHLPADVDPSHGFPLFAAAITLETEQVLAARGRGRTRGAFDAWLSRFAAAREANVVVSTYTETHEAVARCEMARAAGEDTGADWLRVADAWDAAPEPYRAAYARIRGAEALLREGDRELAASVLTDAHADRRPDRRRPPGLSRRRRGPPRPTPLPRARRGRPGQPVPPHPAGA